MPMFSIVFGQVLDSFSDPKGSSNFLQTVNQISLYMFLVALGAFIFGYFEVSLLSISAHRQASKLREVSISFFIVS